MSDEKNAIGPQGRDGRQVERLNDKLFKIKKKHVYMDHDAPLHRRLSVATNEPHRVNIRHAGVSIPRLGVRLSASALNFSCQKKGARDPDPFA